MSGRCLSWLAAISEPGITRKAESIVILYFNLNKPLRAMLNETASVRGYCIVAQIGY